MNNNKAPKTPTLKAHIYPPVKGRYGLETPGFCCVVTEESDLRTAVLMAGPRPVEVVSSIREAVEMASPHYATGPLVVWAAGRNGVMNAVATIS
jgi:hypothetical protein